MENTIRVLFEEISKLFVDTDLICEATSHEFDSEHIDHSKEIVDAMVARVSKKG